MHSIQNWKLKQLGRKRSEKEASFQVVLNNGKVPVKLLLILRIVELNTSWFNYKMDRLQLCRDEYQRRGVNQRVWATTRCSQILLHGEFAKVIKLNKNCTVICPAFTTMAHWCICP